ncbi:MAG: helix-turn-helix transcriptional regulator [Hyphomicrobiales bacterium]|nr:helix-turn-helix transcriptional regulator [Hyphomicrobiales bacterium]
MLRADRDGGGAPAVLFVRGAEAGAAGAAALTVTLIAAHWPDGLDAALARAFAFTGAEVEILRLLAGGLRVKDIAARRGRSVDTIRTQIRSMLEKSETGSQDQLVLTALNMAAHVATPAVRGRRRARRRPGRGRPDPRGGGGGRAAAAGAAGIDAT